MEKGDIQISHSEVKPIKQFAIEFIRSLPKEGVALHLTTAKNAEDIEREGIKSPRDKIWYFAFAANYPVVDNFSSTGIEIL